jgi:hypothetical protein
MITDEALQAALNERAYQHATEDPTFLELAEQIGAVAEELGGAADEITDGEKTVTPQNSLVLLAALNELHGQVDKLGSLVTANAAIRQAEIASQN